MTRKQSYLKLARTMDTDYLAACAASPSPYMSWVHVALIRLELRRRGCIASYYAGVAAEEGWA